MKRKRLSFLLYLTLAVFLAVGSAAAAAPQRIISLAPSITENLFALGAGDRVVGVTSWCDYPAEAQTKTVIGDAMNLNLELLLSLEPDLVVGDSNLVASHIESLQEFGIEVFVIAPTDLAGVRQSLLELGDAIGASERARELAAEMEQRQRELVASVSTAEKIRVFVEIWNEPLMTAGPGSFIDEIIGLAGGENIAHDADNPWPMFSEELVIERDPQVVILTAFNLEEALARSAWQGITALQRGQVFEVDPNLYSRTTPRLLDALEEMISILAEVRK
ncbi:MAG: cobalamin-binding protein [Firmicutes bacterium]|jgi:iron complex transport system substrate-binding protein|nr:cobalamin-binding protein [Bacillota bacterium]NLO66163.1 cobalamin-binding protein [Bacillota bacterium]